MGSWGYISEYGGDCVLCGKGTTKDEDYHSYYPDTPMVALAPAIEKVICNVCADEDWQDQLVESGDATVETIWEWKPVWPNMYSSEAESFAAQETKALDGGTIPTPLVWVDGGGQLPYSHVVVDVSGSMMAAQVVPNHSGPETFSRSDYVMFLLLEMYHSGAIKADTRIYPHTSRDWDSFISAGFLFGKGEAYGPEVWPILFEPRAGSTHLDHMGELPHTKTLLITDMSPQFLPPMVGGTWVVSPEYKQFGKAVKKWAKATGWPGERPTFSGVRGWLKNAPFDMIAW